MVGRIYTPELQLNKLMRLKPKPYFWIYNYLFQADLFHPKYMISDDFDFYIVHFPHLDGDVPRSASYGVYISQLIRFARVSSRLTDFSAGNKTFKLLQ